MAELVQYYGTGRRKRAIARVYLRPGSGDFKVNGRAFEEYFVTPAQRSAAKAPLASSEMAATFNVIASVLGGGVRGGKVYGKWPGLANEQLNEGRDLTVTTDFRQVLGEAAYKTLGAKNLNTVFPGARLNPTDFLNFM